MNNAAQSIRCLERRSFTLLRDTRGLSTVEYVIILVLVAVLAIGTWRTFGNSVKERVTESTGSIDKLKTSDDKSKSGP